MRAACLFAILSLAAFTAAAAQSVIKETVPGIVNFSKVEGAIACAGATTPAALEEVKKQGYASVLNLRMANEAGAEVEAAAAAAKSLGLTYIHLPMNSASPDPGLVDSFLTAVTEKRHQPVFIHCASANRAAALWMVKRMVVDKWDAEKAGTEAAALGLTNPALKTFALEQAAKRR
ncbi:MAG: sulfur transferase domain-containing protein [Vicinamibacterales bacterium]